MFTARPDLGLLLFKELPPEFEESFEDLETEGVAVGILRIPSGPFAGLELYLPAAVGLFVASSYFGGLLKKAGEDHYVALKEVARRLWARASKLRVTAIGSPGKVSPNNKYSLAFAITGAISPEVAFKLVLEADVGEATAQEAIPAFLDTIRSVIEGTLGRDDLDALLTYRPMGGVMLVTFDSETRRIVPVNAMAAQ